nr:MAG TPA: hypothetical protein [Bacteriophage sp.]
MVFIPYPRRWALTVHRFERDFSSPTYTLIGAFSRVTE